MEYINQIKSYKCDNKLEEAEKRVILDYVGKFKDDILTRENEFAHITSSGVILNESIDKMLMIHHNIYNTWAWTGGHADGEEDLLYLSIKEAKEETGVKDIKAISEDIMSLDIMSVVKHMKNGKAIASHMHLNAAYALIADETQELFVKEDENSDVSWVPVEDINKYSNEPEVAKIYMKVISKIKDNIKNNL